jgi:hypothetical protein
MARRDAVRMEREGVALCALVVVTLAAWMAGWAWLVVPGTLGILGLAAATVGADTRAAGDWRPTDRG